MQLGIGDKRKGKNIKYKLFTKRKKKNIRLN